jgi:predicted GH43/DUF377 family glycosyl hydrolase
MTVKIEDIRYLPIKGEFEVTVVDRDPFGKELAKVVANSKSLTRLCAIIAPAKPENM